MGSEQIAIIVAAALGAGGLGAALTYLTSRRGMSGQAATTDADRLWMQNDRLIETLRTDNTDLRVRLTQQDARLFKFEQSERECQSSLALISIRLTSAEEALKIRTAHDAIVAVGEQVTAVGKEVSATLKEVKTGNAKPLGAVGDAVWDEQIRIKEEEGVPLEPIEQVHHEAMAKAKEQGQ